MAPAPTDRPRRTQPERRATTHRRILEAATALIAERGSRGVTLAEIGAHAGYSRGIVAHQFANRHEMLLAVVDHVQQQFAIEREDGGLDALLAFVELYVRKLQTLAPAGQALLVLWTEALAGEPALAELFSRRDKSFHKVIAAHLRQGVIDGDIAAGIDPDTAATYVLSVLRGVGLQTMVRERGADLAELAELSVNSLRATLSTT